MEQHPIPQNITGFEFKLIGEMTIKQFAYLAGGAVLTYLTFISPLHPLVKFPLVLFLPLFGIALAFIPIEGRPLDRWITNFIRAMFSPSQYLFHQQGGHPAFLEQHGSITPAQAAKDAAKPKPVPKSEKFSAYLQSLTPNSPAPLATGDDQRLSEITQVFTTFSGKNDDGEKAKAQQKEPQEALGDILSELPPARPEQQDADSPMVSLSTKLSDSAPAPNHDFEEKMKEAKKFEDENKQLRQQLLALEQKLLATGPHAQAAPQQNQEQLRKEALEIEKKLHDALSEKEQLAGELAALKSKLAQAAPANGPAAPTPVTIVQPAPDAPTVRSIPATQAKAAGFMSLPQIPNLVAGIVKDSKNDVLPNIIVEVKDATGNPVRAFKTNKLGQFSASTSLSNGRYTIELDDPRNTYAFDIVAVELTGSYVAPIEILAKDQATKERDQLYKALFGSKPVISD